MNSNKCFILLFLALLTVGFSSGCGVADGYANSGTTNTYNFIYFGNNGNSTINSYYIKKDGTFTIVANTISTGLGTSSVNDLVGSPDGKFLYSANKSTNNVSWYTLDSVSGGAAGTPTFSSVADAQGTGTSAIKIHPNGNLCFIANSTSITNNISICSINKVSGAMTVDDDTFYTARTTPTNLVISPDGRLLFVVNRGTSDVSTFTINSVSGALNTVDLSVAAGTNPEDLVIHPNGNFLYTLSTGSNAIYMHSVSGSGALAALSPATIATGATPKKIVITADGKFVFITNFAANSIGAYSVDATSGLLTAVAGSPFAAVAGAGVYALAATPESNFLVVTGDTAGKAYIYSIGSNGVLTYTSSEITVGANPRTVVFVQQSAVD